jgi:large subunit ribosomal protein L21
MYAVIETGGKQYRVGAGETVRVERLTGENGASVEFDKVLMVGGDEAEPLFGTPYLESGKVTGTIEAQGRQRKIEVIKFKRRKNYRRHKGHRQSFTDIRITGIESAQSTNEVISNGT